MQLKQNLPVFVYIRNFFLFIISQKENSYDDQVLMKL